MMSVLQLVLSFIILLIDLLSFDGSLLGLAAVLVPAHEMDSLQHLFESTSGYAWNWLPEVTAGAIWNFTKDNSGEYVDNPCSSNGLVWQGVYCSDSPLECALLNCTIIGLDLSSYGLAGAVPAALANLSSMKLCDFSSNELVGTIPPELGLLKSLKSLRLDSNDLTGSIPSDLSTLTSLLSVRLGRNSLNGTIPSELGNLPMVVAIGLSSNDLTGTIPPELGKLNSLEWFMFDYNSLTGFIPSELGNLLSVKFFTLSSNELTGTIPGVLGNLPYLQWLLLDSNNLAGTIPAALGNLSIVNWLLLDSNKLTGSIPAEFGDLLSVELLFLYNNELTGTLPPELGNLLQVQWLFLESNIFTGFIPSEIGHMLSLEYFYVSSNRLTGSIPSEIGFLSKLKRLWLDSNELSGSIPSELGNLQMLEVIDLGSNVLTGEIPSALGKLNAAVLALSVNCLESKLPDSLCDMQSVEVLSLNGLSYARNCENTLTVPWSDTIALSSHNDFEIPSCVWAMESLTTLHITGNGYLGEINAQNFGSGLVDVSLSHNRLSGTIPNHILGMTRVDLSYNRFEGHLSGANYANGSLLHTEVNRLSGRLPTDSLANFSSLAVLRGNMFSCATIPENDVDSFGYSCGSALYDYSLFLTAACIACFIIFFMYRMVNSQSPVFGVIMENFLMFYRCLSSYNIDDNLRQDFDSKDMPEMCQKMMLHMQFIVTFFLIIVCVSVPVYAMRLADPNNNYTSHWNTYTWTLSFRHLEGQAMGALCLVVWVIAALSLFVYVYVYLHSARRVASLKAKNRDEKRDRIDCKKWNLKSTSAFFSNVFVTSGVNILYILSTTELSLSPMSALAIRFCVSIFRVLSSVVIVPLLANWEKDPVKKCIFIFRLLMFNNFLIPCIVTALTSPNCFQELLIEPEGIQTVYEYEECMNYMVTSNSTTCLSEVSVSRETAKFVPGFTYNFQCTSVLLEAYIPVLIMGCCIQLLLPPFLIYVVTCKRYSSFPSSIRLQLHGVFWPQYWHKRVSNSPEFIVDPAEIFYSPSILCNDIIHPVAVMMTFGLCSPPLALLAAIVGALNCCMYIGAVTQFCRYVKEEESRIGCSDKWSAHPLVCALCDMPFPYAEVMTRAFRIISALSLMLILFLYWDIVGNVEWEASVALGIFVFVLCSVAFYRVMRTVQKTATRLATAKKHQDSSIEFRSSTMNPLSSST